MKPIPLTERYAILTENEGWFGSAAPEFQQAVLSRFGWREVMAGQPIYSASDVQTDPCGIVDGTVEVYSRYGAGDNPMLHLSHEGSWVGYGAVVRGQPLRVSVVARTSVLLASVPRRAMQDLLCERPERQSVPVTQDELATLVNVSRTTLLQILRRLEDRGLVEQAYRALRVVDAAGLADIAAGRESHPLG